VGNGEVAKEGSHVRVHYTGWLTNGKKFDSSVDAGKPFDFTIGNGEVIKGWEEGVSGMKVGGKRQLRIPPNLAYGTEGTPGGPIPPNATLIFDVQLLGVQ
jgi:FKBP-type peptidyl-prolyl cis-trans isomerase